MTAPGRPSPETVRRHPAVDFAAAPPVTPATRVNRGARATRSIAGLALAVLALAACTSATPLATSPVAATAGVAQEANSSGPASTTPAAADATPVTLTPSVADGASVPVDTLVTVAAKAGTISTVDLTYRDPKAGVVTVGGDISPDGSTWTARSLLEPGATYSLSMSGTNAAGTAATATSSFTTQALSNKQQISASMMQRGGTVGVAMPVVIQFSSPVTDKAAFERAMKVTSTPSQEGAWAWISSREAHFRPRNYWQPGTKVAVSVAINGLGAGNGNFGKSDLTGSFTVGNSLIMKADLAAHQMQVVIDGTVARTIPVSGGRKGMETRSGTKVIIEKWPEKIMDAATTGTPVDDPDYYRTLVKYAMRETWSGEFVHAAPWSVASQGRANVSHGCIGMSTANAAWLFNQAKVGDPVVVTGTGRALERGNGWTDWNISFEAFKKGSALG